MGGLLGSEELRRSGTVLLYATSGTKGFAVSPLHTMLLVATELLGGAAEIVGGEGLLDGHDGSCWRDSLTMIYLPVTQVCIGLEKREGADR
jgi:hypothetical protein